MPVIKGEKLQKESTKDFAYRVLKEKILSLELKPGTKISEKDIAEQLGVSRTPIRESFLRLSQENLLEIYPQSGTFVSLIDLTLVEEARFVRENMERAIVRLACDKLSDEDFLHLQSNLMMQDLSAEKGNHGKLFELDEAFHRILYFGCGKKRTWHLVQQMNHHFKRLRMLRLSTDLDWSILISQHRGIYEAIQRGDTAEAEDLMKQHLRLAVVETDVLRRRYQDFFK